MSHGMFPELNALASNARPRILGPRMLNRNSGLITVRRVILELPVKRRLPDAEQPCSLQLVAVKLGNRIQYRLPFQLRDRNNLQSPVPIPMRRFGSGQVGDFSRQIGGVDERPAGEGVGAFQAVL